MPKSMIEAAAEHPVQNNDSSRLDALAEKPSLSAAETKEAVELLLKERKRGRRARRSR